MSERALSFQFLAIFVALSVAVIGAGSAYFAFERNQLYKSKLNELETIAELKVKSIIEWRGEIVKDGRLIGFLPTSINPYAVLLKHPEDTAALKAVDDYSTFLMHVYEYRGVRLYAANKPAPVFVGAPHSSNSPFSAKEDLEGIPTDGVSVGTLYRHEQDGRISLNLRIPIATESGAGLRAGAGILILEIDAEKYLFPLIKTWPTASDSGESLLVKRTGNDVLFLNELRFKSGTAMVMNFPIEDNPLLPAAIATQNMIGPAKGIDYRGVKVIAWVRPVSGTDWKIVVKIDEAEAFSSVTFMRTLIIVIIVLFIFAAGFSSFVLWRRRLTILELRAGRAELARLALAEKFEHLTRYANDSIILADDSLSICEANDSACTLYGYERQEFIGKKIGDLTVEPLSVYTTGESPIESMHKGYRFETRRLRKNGGSIWVEVSTRVFPMGNRFFIQEIARDVTEAKKSREAILVSIREKEILLRELHHRTKNNMQVICSLLLLQAGETDNEGIRMSYREMVGRIRSMALVHEKLYQSANLSNLDLCVYIRELSGLIVGDLSSTSVALRVDTPEKPIPVLLDVAIPCGLVLNELLSNSFKHAFEGEREPRITIALTARGTDIELCVADNGRGFPSGFDVREKGHMGWQTIIAIVESQLLGNVEVRSERGTTVVVKFSTMLYEERV
ncbi:MAG: histidine kinase dimerization/phosphoacceptor domain -containing protein [Treponemataceae bacterium]